MMLKDKIAIVTGAAKGIGRGIALVLSQEGAKVVVSDLNMDECLKVVTEIEALGGEAIAVKCDVSIKDEVDALISDTVSKFGSLDILVNNAGIFPFIPFESMTEKNWDQVLDVNLKSIFLTSQAVAKIMKPGSKIVNISSIASYVGFSGLVHYCASKGGLNSMIRALALELADKKINVNNVAPGAIETPGATGAQTEEMKQGTIAIIPAGRMGQPEDIANVVVFLASDKADYITGQTLVVDGGYILK
jgi:NAD(P)-dependent dehydrogenase (short-subunit alcohol dehydrogenase family)